MMPLPRPYGILIVFGYAVLHYIWAAMLAYDNVASWATSLAPIWHQFGAATPFVLVGFATLALASLFMRDRQARVVLLVPQQILAFLSAGGVIVAIWNGQYADGVLHPPIQIASDQIGYVICSLLHLVAMFQIAARVR